MAVHSQTGPGGAYGRKFTIMRQDGITKKGDGEPFFFEFITALPPEDQRKGRTFETRVKGDGKTANYELFKALDGILSGVRVEQKNMGTGGVQDWLVLSMQDGAEDYVIEVGEMDGRFAMDLMKRLLDPYFVPTQKLRMSPYLFIDAQGKASTGVACISGVDAKLSASSTGNDKMHKNVRLEGVPQATKWTHPRTGKDEYDFRPVAQWLWAQLIRFVIPKLVADPLNAVRPTPEYATGPANTNVRASDEANRIDYTAPASTDANFPTSERGHYSAPPPRQESPQKQDDDGLPF